MTLALSLLTASAGADEQDDYQAGHLAMAKQNWSLASEKFAAAAGDKDLADSATYWQAYVLYQSKQNGRARALLRKLEREFPNSQWVDDAQLLMAEHGDLSVEAPVRVRPTRPAQSNRPTRPPRPNHPVVRPVAPGVTGAVTPPQPPTAEDELRLFAIQQMMETQPKTAVKMIKELYLEAPETTPGAQTNAIHLLGISDAPEAEALLYEYIEKAKNAGLKAQAIQMLGLRGGVENQKRLVDMYEHARENAVKSAIINSFIHLDNGQLMASLLKKETDQGLSNQMMHMLGAMGEAEVLKELYRETAKASKKAALLESLAVAGESAMIKDVIANEQDKELRRAAVHSLMMLGEADSDYALDLYRKSNDIEEKRTLASLMMVTDMDAGVIKDLFLEAKDPELKRHLLTALISQHALDELEQVYLNESDPEIKREIIHHLGAVGNPEQIRRLAQADPSIKESEGFYLALGMSGDSKDMQYLADQYPDASDDGKARILQALMMQGDVSWLMKVYQSTSDPKDKKHILRTIGMLDPEALLKLIEEQ